MSAEVAVESTVEESLALSVRTIDAARRVGWAKAFEALARVDSLEEEVRQTRDELKYLRRAYSRLLGFINDAPFPRSEVFDAELARHFAAERTFRHEDAWDQGRALAAEHVALLDMTGMSEAQIAARRIERKIRSDAAKTIGREARERGHDIESRLTVGRKHIPVRCTCGHEFPEGSTSGDLLDHISEAVTGKKFDVLVAGLIAERGGAR